MAKKKTPETSQQKREAGQVPIVWNIPDAVNSIFASNMLVQILEHEFKLLFFETKPTPRTSADQPEEEAVRADCVASIIVSPMKLPAIIGVLQRQFEVFLKREGLKLDETGRIIPSESEQPS